MPAVRRYARRTRRVAARRTRRRVPVVVRVRRPVVRRRAPMRRFPFRRV